MITVKLGQTGLEINPVGFGGIPIQRISTEDASHLVEYAIHKGMNFIDTARVYTDSEEKIGQVLPKHVDKVIIATKSVAKDRETMAADIQISLNNLKVDSIDLYQLHNVRTQEALDTILGENGAYEALAEAKAQGKIKHIGITGHKPSILVQAIKTGKFETVQVPFNIVETEALKELIPLCKEMNIGIIGMKPVAGGALKDHVPASLKHILNNSVTVVIPGVDSTEQIDQNLSILEDLTLTAQEAKDLQAEADSLGSQFCRKCDYCAPCPQGIDIPSMFVLNGYYTRYNMPEWSSARYQALTTDASACIECGQCESKCPYELPIISMLKEAHSNMSKKI